MKVRPLRGLICLIAATVLTVSCGGGGSGGGEDTVVFPETAPALNGNFNLSINGGLNSDFVELMDGALAPRVAYLNRVTDLPKDIPVAMEDCGISNAFYVLELSDQQLAELEIDEQFNGPLIFLCWELLYDTLNFFNDAFEDPEVAVLSSLGAYTQVLYHEVGHALDDQLDLPIVGNTESAADSIATVLAVEEGFGIFPLSAALLFDASGDGSFAAVHPGGADRAGDLFCWALGGDADLAGSFTELMQIFANSGRDCVAEYAALLDSVTTLLPGIAGTFAKQPPVELTDAALEDLRTAVLSSNAMAKMTGAN